MTKTLQLHNDTSSSHKYFSAGRDTVFVGRVVSRGAGTFNIAPIDNYTCNGDVVTAGYLSFTDPKPRVTDDWVVVGVAGLPKKDAQGRIVSTGNNVTIRDLKYVDADNLKVVPENVAEAVRSLPTLNSDIDSRKDLGVIFGRAEKNKEESISANRQSEDVDIDTWFPVPIAYIPESREELKAVLSPGYTRIGYTSFLLPPGAIVYTNNYPTQAKPLLRSTSMLRSEAGVYSRELQMNFEFADPTEINTVLLPLIRQFMRTPFLPVVNSYINDTLEIDSVALQSIRMDTIPDFPGAVNVSLQMIEHNNNALMPGEGSLDSRICYPLLKLWCETNTPTKPLPDKMNQRFSWNTPSERYLKAEVEKITKMYSDLTAGENEAADAIGISVGIAYLEGDAGQKKELERTHGVVDIADVSFGVKDFFVTENVFGGGGLVGVPTATGPAFVTKLKDLVFIKTLLRGLPSEQSVRVLSVQKLAGGCSIVGSPARSDILTRLNSILSSTEDAAVNSDYVNLMEELRNLYFVVTPKDVGLLRSLVDIYSGRSKSGAKVSASRARDILSKKWVTWEFPSFSVEHVSVASENLLSAMKCSSQDTPVHQFVGRSDTYITLTGVVTQEVDVRNIKRLFSTVDALTRRYGGLSHYEGYLKVENELFSLFGVDHVLPLACEVTTVENYPGTYNVVIQLVQFDPEQKAREQLNAIDTKSYYLPNNVISDDDKKPDHLPRPSDGFPQHMDRATDFHKRLRRIELYPDMRLPTYATMCRWVDDLKSLTPAALMRKYHLSSWQWTPEECGLISKPKNSKSYVDPDFYCVPSYAVGSSLIDGVIRGLLDPEKEYNKLHLQSLTDGSGDLAFWQTKLVGDDKFLDSKKLYDAATAKAIDMRSADTGVDSYSGGSGIVSDKNPKDPKGVIQALRKAGCSNDDIQYLIEYSKQAKLPIGLVGRWFLQEGGINQTKEGSNTHAGMGQMGHSAVAAVNKALNGRTTPWGAKSVTLDDRFPDKTTGHMRPIWLAIQYMKQCCDSAMWSPKTNGCSVTQKYGLGVLSYVCGGGSVSKATSKNAVSSVVANPNLVDYAASNHMSTYLPNVLRGLSETDEQYITAFSALLQGKLLKVGAVPVFVPDENSAPSEAAKEKELIATPGSTVGNEEGPAFCTVLNSFYDPKNGRDQFYDMRKYCRYGRLLQAFPTYCMLLVDGGRWLRFWRFYDKWFGMSAIQSIAVTKSRKSPVDVAVISISNMYGFLTREPAEKTWGQFNESKQNVPFRWSMEYVFNGLREKFVGAPSKDTLEKWGNYANSLMLRPGTRIHLRLGYGSNANNLPVVFNGVISEVPPGQDELEITALGDGVELVKKLNSNAGVDGQVYKSLSFFGGGTSPREIINRIMAPATLGALLTKGGYLHDNPHGIEHFGAMKYGFLQADVAECAMNVYAPTPAAVKSDNIAINQHTSPSQVALENLNLIPGWGVKDGGSSNFLIGISMENATPWEVFTACQRAVPDFIVAVHPFETRSTLFYGKPHWPVRYEYTDEHLTEAEVGNWLESQKTQDKLDDFSNYVTVGLALNPLTTPLAVGSVLAKAMKGHFDSGSSTGSGFVPDKATTVTNWKPYSQIHIVSSSINLVSNSIKATDENMYTQCQAVGTHNGINFGPGGIVQNITNAAKALTGMKPDEDTDNERSAVMELDSDIYQEHQKMLYVTSGLYSTARMVMKDMINNLNLMAPWQCRQTLNTYAAQTLKESVKDMYDGDCIIMGDPAMKPMDRVFLSDMRTQMVGVAEVKECTHVFSFANGLTTSWSPDLLTSLTETADQMSWGWLTLFGARFAAGFGLRATAANILARSNPSNALMSVLSFREQIRALSAQGVSWALTMVNGDATMGLVGMDGTLAAFLPPGKGDVSDRIDNLTAYPSSFNKAVKRLDDSRSAATLISQLVGLARQAGAAEEVVDPITKPLTSWLEAANVVRDLTTLGKSLGGGLTQSNIEAALAANKEIACRTHMDLIIETALWAIIPGIRISANSLSDWLMGKFRARQCLVMYPLTVAGKEFSAGIEGHAGAVAGDLPGFWDGVIDSIKGIRTGYSTPRYGLSGVTQSGNQGGLSNYYRGLVMWNMRPQEFKTTGRADALFNDASYSSMGDLIEGMKDSVNPNRVKGGSGAGNADGLISTAMSYIGKVNYVFGGTSTKTGMDCSAFVRMVFNQHGQSLPRTSREQRNVGSAVKFEDLQAGDRLYFDSDSNGNTDHTGIYVGDGNFVHCSGGKGVGIDTLTKGFYKRIYFGARRGG